MILLVVGGSGFLGREVVRQGVAAGHRVTATHLTRPPGAEVSSEKLDVRDRAAVEDLVSRVRPDVVINTAYQSKDWASTADGAIHVALAATATGARLVHVSSDALFSGQHDHYDESARPDPITPYGAAKAAAETAIMIINPAAVVARTSLIIGDGDSPTERLVHALVAKEATGGLFTDDFRCPVHVADLAAALLELGSGDRAGIHHLAGPDSISRHDLGILIARRDGLDPALLPTATRAGSGIPGPLDVRLDCTETQRTLRTRLRGAREFLSG
ncbi:SDR family oxidoreductase [Microlunatus parietis]|uniref:dTDP-4-dehydrorhamnose reductase n=1 Tax=Microlunatus parietis TaxID=682979 RepID=A0A7Y9I7L6_9ACTN|nr:sugar nucleotide-binding protein [Microlunatus parietis]NYE71801.1 dTDP-4-dehydrorhamnose reductase [Microlunatus parietis]